MVSHISRKTSEIWATPVIGARTRNYDRETLSQVVATRGIVVVRGVVIRRVVEA